MYISNQRLSANLCKYYQDNDKNALDDFFADVYHIAYEVGRMSSFIRINQLDHDFAVFCSMSVLRQVEKRAIDPSRNIHPWLVGNFKFRRIDIYRKYQAQHARDAIIEQHLKQEILSSGTKVILTEDEARELIGCGGGDVAEGREPALDDVA